MALLYYSNETSPLGLEREAYQTIAKWLKSSDESELVRFSSRIEQDADVFAKTVDRESNAFRKLQINHELFIPILVATNRLAKNHLTLLYNPEVTEPEYFALDVSPDLNPVMSENPTSTEKFFEEYLKLARKIFPPEKYEFILITKSHGNSEMAMMPFIRIWPSEIRKEEFLNLVRKSLLTKKDSNIELPQSAHLRGVTKKVYKNILDESGMRFRIVVMESCFGGPSPDVGASSVSLPSNVLKLFGASDHGIPYENIDYLELFKKPLNAASFSQSLERSLQEKFSVEQRRFDLQELFW